MTISRASHPALLVLLLVVPAGACATVHGTFQRAPRVSGPVDLEVETGSGDVTVTSGPPGQVSITGRITAGSSMFGGGREDDVRDLERNPPLRQEGNSIKLDGGRYDNVSIDYEITVPPDTRLRSDTGSGNHTVRGLRGDIAIKAGSGDIRMDDIVGGVFAETGSGNVRANRIAGSLEARTGSGDIEVLLSGPGNVRASTGSGDADIRGVVGGLSLETGSGTVVVEGDPRSPWQVDTSSGDVRLRLPAQSSFNVELSTGSGDISVARPVHTVVQGHVSSESDHVAGKVGSGGPLVKVSTGSGDVSVE
ncbi:MAG TPA: DUF4097 family beta strand repeat-containing protein [Kofleriaceae bacterium]|nr:DUF4097 family beta strand repeat-containing protein [Kofleriaceae bacterium]